MDDDCQLTLGKHELRRLVRADSVHRSVYTDRAIFDLEMDRIFGRTWVYVGHDSRLSAQEIQNALVSGFNAAGVKVLDPLSYIATSAEALPPLDTASIVNAVTV